jgi:hypothetical protein
MDLFRFIPGYSHAIVQEGAALLRPRTVVEIKR